jgi:hypothetical protein
MLLRRLDAHLPMLTNPGGVALMQRSADHLLQYHENKMQK